MNARFFDVKKAKQDAVINAALKIFSECGYKKASTDLIVKEAGISKGLLFHYFENKMGCYEFIYDYSVKYMTLELTRAVNKSEKDFFKVQVQVERAKTRVMKNYPYMQLFINNARFENDPEAIEAMGDNRNVMQETYNGIYSQTDNTCFMDKIDINRIISMINWMSDGFIKDNLSKGEYDLDDMNEEFEKYLNMLRRHFYRAPGEDMVSIARSEMVERDDTIMDQLRLNATFEERLQAGHTGSFDTGAEAAASDNADKENEQIKEALEGETAENAAPLSDEAVSETDNEPASKADTETETPAETSDQEILKEDASDNSSESADTQENTDKALAADDEETLDAGSSEEKKDDDALKESEPVKSAEAEIPVQNDEVALPSWWTQGSNTDSDFTISEPVMSEIPVPEEILHTTLKKESDEEETDEEEEESWSPRPVHQIRL